MITVNLKELELNEFIARDDETQHCKSAFPLVGAHGTERSATVYIELEPGNSLGRHTDSAEELLFVIEGEVEVTVGNEKGYLSQDGIAVVPVMVPHDLKNVGRGKARVLGFFGGANNIVATFDKTWLPANSNVVDTAKLFEPVA